MANIILDSRKIMVYEDLKYLSEFCGKNSAFADELWSGMLENEELYQEFMYYLDNHSLKDEMRVEGYTLTDIYVNSLWSYNLFADTGKNTAACSKDSMVLDTFMGMLKLIRNPEEYKKNLHTGKGMDKL